MRVLLIIITIVIVLCVLLGIGFIFFLVLVEGLDSSMREKYPLDYLLHIGWVIKIFEDNGFIAGQYINPGTDFPGIYIHKDGMVVSLLLKADKYPFKIICIDKKNDKILFEIQTKKSDALIAEIEESDKILVTNIISHL